MEEAKAMMAQLERATNAGSLVLVSGGGRKGPSAGERTAFQHTANYLSCPVLCDYFPVPFALAPML